MESSVVNHASFWLFSLTKGFPVPANWIVLWDPQISSVGKISWFASEGSSIVKLVAVIFGFGT